MQGTKGGLCGQSRMSWGSTVQNEAGEGTCTRSGRTLPVMERSSDFFSLCKGKPFEGFKQRSDMTDVFFKV